MGWSRFFRRTFWDAERRRELEAYIAEETDDNIARGMAPDAARTAALRKLGNPTRIREEIYSMNSIGFIETLLQDVRYGLRLLRRNPTFAIVAILTLALGTGANTAIFQLLNAVTLRTLPVDRPEDLVEVKIVKTREGRTGQFMGSRPSLSNPLWERVRAEQQVFSGMLAWGATTWNLADGGEERPAQGLFVSGGFFSTLGVPAQAGRVIAPSDDVRGCARPGAVLSDAFWRREFGADRSVVGRSLLLDGQRFDVIGVAAPSFSGVEVGRSFDVALPICSEPIFRGPRTGLDLADVWFLGAFGRLKPGVTMQQASAQLEAISPQIFRATVPPRYAARTAKDYVEFKLGALPAATGVSALRSNYQSPLNILLGVTALVLLIACANLANLMLARATAREREIAVRLAIGASRARILRQLLSESLLIALLGGAAGVLAAAWFSGFLVSFLSGDMRGLFVDLRLDWRVFGFTAAVAVMACLLFGLAPAIRATRASPGSTIKAGGRGMTDGRERFGLRRALVVVQVALSLVLVVGALLFVRSLRNLTHLDPGFRQDGVLVASADYRKTRIPETDRTAVNRIIVERLRALAGVDGAAEAFTTPVGGNFWNEHIVIGGAEQEGNVNFNSVGPGYFRAMSIALLAGRDVAESDTPQSPKVAVVSETFARKYFQGARAVGQTFQVAAAIGEPRPFIRIVGIVRDTKYTDLREPFTPLVYLAAHQEDQPGPFPQFVMHAVTGLDRLSPAVTRVLADVNPAITVQYQTVRSQVRSSLLRERLMATLSGIFGGLAVVIATLGLYGVMSYMVARRRTEIGIRMALGADRKRVVRLIVREAVVLLAAGLIAGGMLSIAAARSASALLYGIKPWDPATLGMGIAALAGVSLLAAWLPARRASRVAPNTALREE
jgi:predicted permease